MPKTSLCQNDARISSEVFNVRYRLPLIRRYLETAAYLSPKEHLLTLTDSAGASQLARHSGADIRVIADALMTFRGFPRRAFLCNAPRFCQAFGRKKCTMHRVSQ